MRIIIKYDDGTEEEVEFQKKAVIQNKEKRLAHYYINTEDNKKILIAHLFLPTNEEPTYDVAKVQSKIEHEIKAKVSEIPKYKNVADELISKAKTATLLPNSRKCYYCDSLATNEYNGKPVCSECFGMLVRYGETSKQFINYLATKKVK